MPAMDFIMDSMSIPPRPPIAEGSGCAGGGAVNKVLQASGFVFLSLRMTRFLPGFLRSDASSIEACKGESVRHLFPDGKFAENSTRVSLTLVTHKSASLRASNPSRSTYTEAFLLPSENA